MSSGFSARPVRSGVTMLARRDIPARDLSVIFVVEYLHHDACSQGSSSAGLVCDLCRR